MEGEREGGGWMGEGRRVEGKGGRGRSGGSIKFGEA